LACPTLNKASSIVENTWGSDWGEKGYAKMIGGRGDTQIDMYSLGISVTPYTVYDYYSMQNMAKEAGNMGQKDDV